MQKMGLEHTRVFPLIVLKGITNNFSEERVIGHGGSGVVYKGVLDSGEEIAVKKLHNRYDSSGNKLGNGEAQFLNELMNLIGIQHQNIIRLVGYCYETHNIVIECDGKRVLACEEERVLCLEYMEGGSLKDHLSDESCGLEWHTRFNIIIGVCEGLKYLHTGSENPIYHLDLKPENIWLDRNMIPKIGDFGISRLPAGSMQTYATENAVSGTIGYMAPEYIGRNQISQKCDIYSLGFIMIRVIAGEKGPANYDPHRPPEEFIESVHKNWGRRWKATMSSHSLHQVKTCTEIALRCVEFNREKRPTITDIVNELNKIKAPESSAICGKNTEEEEHTTLEKQPAIQEQKENNAEQLEGKMKEKVDGRSAISPLHYRWSGSHEQDIQGHVLHLQSGVQHLKDTLPAMYNLIDEAEWRNHKTCVAELLPKLKDAVYDADDLLDEFRWYEIKVKLEGGESKSPFTYFLDVVIQGSFNKLDDVQGRMQHLFSQLVRMVPRKEPRRFDKLIRPETSSRPYEGTIFGRDNELKQVMGFLNIAKNSQRKRAKISVGASTSTAATNQVSNEKLPVLPIVGIGGVGKTTLAQRICSHEEVKSHFDPIIWICVSDDFDDKRLIREVLSCSGKEATTDNLDALQCDLSNHLNNKRFLIILDDMWEDTLKEYGQCWKRFYMPFESAQKGSMMLITTRCPKVAEGVGTMEPFELKGLQDDVLWNFFKLCVFGSQSSNSNPELERIGREILPKLKGSPLAAKTLGHMLSMDLQAAHWNAISKSELWELKQEATDILPALRLSYMYLPLYLKRCFSFCAVYPKDYIFEKKDLTEIWVAEGFVDSEDIGFQYFEDLVARSFFQKVPIGYVIHDLLHDMAQKVSEHECFILRNKNDFAKIPKDVRHIYIQSSNDILISDLLSLCKHTKLRTMFCKKGLSQNKTNSVINNWCTKLLRMRVLFCASIHKLPDSIGNLKHLRYLQISENPVRIERSEVRPLSIPSTFCWLYNLQTVYVQKYNIESLPNDFSNLDTLERFKSHGFSYYPGCHVYIDAASEEADRKIRIMKNLNQFRGDLKISNCHMLSKDQAAEVKLKNKKYLYQLQLEWMNPCQEHNATEVLELLQPPISLMNLRIRRYPGVFLPSWFRPQNMPSITSVSIEACELLDKISISIVSQNMNFNEIPAVLVDNNNIDSTFLFLTEVTISGCQNLSSLEHFLHPDYVPAIKKLSLENCKSLVSVPAERFGDLRFLEELHVDGCPNIRSHSLILPSFKQLRLGDCGSLLENIYCCSAKKLIISADCLTSIQTEGWSLPALQELNVWGCKSLTFIGVSTILTLSKGTDNIRALSKLSSLNIEYCPKLSILDGLLAEEYIPAIERIHINWCDELVSLPGERFGSFSSLKHLCVYWSSLLNWQSGLVLPSSLQTLELVHCGDFSACVPGCLENLTSLVSLKMAGCDGMTSIPGTIWRSNLALLEDLLFWDCPNLVSIGGAEAVARIKGVRIINCPNLREACEIRSRDPWS